MSNAISHFLKLHPLISVYAQKGLINLNALSRYIKEIGHEADSSISDAAMGMDLRRYLSKLPKTEETIVDFSKYPLQLVVRTNINEVVLNKNNENRKLYIRIINKISQTKYFISIVEGEKEIVLMTDYSLKELLEKEKTKNNITHYINGLSFISINFPIELRLVPGIYNIITSCLAEMNISIHSFHTIGGEILILVKEQDLHKTQETLELLLTS